ncbi:aspartyl protease family protein [Massilia sp. PWRC2]|uniref:aspartyl protease family protein n=1 Tax=Massilia sp. PWRC2 TaxID=2804626 RepID=UPI003CED534E
MNIPFSRTLLLPFALACAPFTAHAAEAPRCKYVSVGELPLRFVGQNFTPTIEGSVNGLPATMLLDTGAERSAMTNPAVDRFQLNARITGRHAEGIGGLSRLYNVRVSEFGIGPIRSKALYLDVLGDTGATPAFDAIVGADFLFQADIEISLAERAVRFFRPLDCNASSYLAYWTQEAVVVPLTGNFGRSKNNTVTVELNGVKFDAIIDTGADRSVVFERAAGKAGVPPEHPSSRKAGSMTGIGSDIVQTRSAVFSSFAIGGETIRDAELLVLPDAGAIGPAGRRIDMLLGADFLRSHRLLFAMSQRQLYISYLGGDVFERDVHGIPVWLQTEADRGNPDALLALASRYSLGKQVPRDGAKAAALLEQAAAQEHRASMIALADLRTRERRHADAASLYSRALATGADDRRLWLLLYLARVRAGQQALGTTELAQKLAANSSRAWPAPVAEFFLGRIDGATLLASAANDDGAAHSCDAQGWMASAAAARGDLEGAKALGAERARACQPGGR